MQKEYNKVKGYKGESQTVKFLLDKKYKIYAQNYKNKVGEIDIIAQDKDTIVFIEVKARETLAFGRPSEAVNYYKQNKIRKVAQIFLIKNNLLDSKVRFDVIEVVGQNINHIENAF
ncbi:MAG: YraN family protein [Clostridia bacterium]|nr:YraN family protein [Clostridia bacterium]